MKIIVLTFMNMSVSVLQECTLGWLAEGDADLFDVSRHNHHLSTNKFTITENET